LPRREASSTCDRSISAHNEANPQILANWPRRSPKRPTSSTTGPIAGAGAVGVVSRSRRRSLRDGGLMDISTMAQTIGPLSRNRQVIGIDRHGRTALRNTPMSHERNGDDVAAVLKHLDIAKLT
jgi:hypothetical protein